MNTSRTRIRPTAAAMLYMLATFSPTAGSASGGDQPPMDGLHNAEEVSDDVLGNMRGKFVGGGQIINFGVQMVSTWQTAAGQMLTAAANLNVNVANTAQPVVEFVPNLTIVEANAVVPASNAAIQTATGNGISNVSGVAQSIQVAGDSNSIGNDAAISITSGPPPAMSPGSSGGPQTATLTSASGAAVSASVQGNGISVGITVPNVGRALQQIKGTAASGGGVVQMVQAAGDMQWIHNRMHIYVNLQPSVAANAQTALSGSLNTLRGLRPMGAF